LEQLNNLNLKRCHENFRVFAIGNFEENWIVNGVAFHLKFSKGAPTPPFIGQPLDPPLRSRFGI
jgi:hypothetical protein